MAVLGREADLASLAPLVDRAEDDVLDAWARAERAHLIERDGNGARFVHDRVREVAYAAIEDPAPLHRRAAEQLEAHPDRDRRLAELATHWDRAGERARARPMLMEAARNAGASFALLEQERLTRAALASAPLDDEGFEGFAGLVHAMLAARPYAAETLALLDEAGTLAAQLGTPQAEQENLLLIGLKHTYHRASERALEAVLPVLDAPTTPARERRAREIKAIAHQRRGDFEGAIAERQRAKAIAEVHETRRAVQIQTQAILDLYARLGRYTEAGVLLEANRPAADAGPDERTQWMSLMGLHLEHTGKYAQAVDLAVRGEQLAREHRLHRRRAVFGVNGGFWAARRGDLDLALQLFDIALDTAREPYLVFNIRINRALAHWFCHRAGAETVFRDLVAEADASGSTYWAQRGRHWLAWMALERGDLATARTILDAIDPTRTVLARDFAEDHHLRTRTLRLEGRLDEARSMAVQDVPQVALIQWGMAAERVHLGIGSEGGGRGGVGRAGASGRKPLASVAMSPGASSPAPSVAGPMARAGPGAASRSASSPSSARSSRTIAWCQADRNDSASSSA